MHKLQPKQRIAVKKAYLFLVFGLLIGGAFSIGYYRYSRPVDPPFVKEILKITDDSTLPVEIGWPAQAQASIGTVEDGILASEPNQQVLPTASTAKVIAVLTILKEKPLALGEQGPVLTIDAQDVRLYNNYAAAGGSLVAVQLGEQLSEYQMLQGILIRSGNNLADSLALWAFGSLSAYQVAAQKLVDELGMTNTTVGLDASGLSETTTSTAEDLTRLGIAAMKNDVVREIIRQPNSNLPVDGIKPSTNWLLGQNGVVGIKTGSLPSIGGVFMIASDFAPEGEEPITIVGTVQGEPSSYDAIARAGQLIETIKPLFTSRTIVKKGTVVAEISTPWGDKSDVVTKEDITTFGWKYRKLTPEITLSSQDSFTKDTILGSLTIDGQSTDLVALDTVNPPSWQWRVATSR